MFSINRLLNIVPLSCLGHELFSVVGKVLRTSVYKVRLAWVCDRDYYLPAKLPHFNLLYHLTQLSWLGFLQASSDRLWSCLKTQLCFIQQWRVFEEEEWLLFTVQNWNRVNLSFLGSALFHINYALVQSSYQLTRKLITIKIYQDISSIFKKEYI